MVIIGVRTLGPQPYLMQVQFANYYWTFAVLDPNVLCCLQPGIKISYQSVSDSNPVVGKCNNSQRRLALRFPLPTLVDGNCSKEHDSRRFWDGTRRWDPKQALCCNRDIPMAPRERRATLPVMQKLRGEDIRLQPANRRDEMSYVDQRPSFLQFL